MPDADLYLARIDVSRYLSSEECRRCGVSTCKELVDRIRERTCDGAQLVDLDAGRAAALMTAAGVDGVLPVVPSLPHPRPVPPGVMELNDPSPGDPVLLTGNSELTQQVLLAVLSTTVSPFFVVFSDTRGDTLDMALVLGSFTPERVGRFFESESLQERLGPGPVVLPGLAESLRDEIGSATGLGVEVGPVCAAELPLWFGDRWRTGC